MVDNENAKQRTLSIIKPDAVADHLIGKIYTKLEESGLIIIAAKMKHLTLKEASEFYAMHKERSFFTDLIEFMASAPVMIQVLEGYDAIERYRDLMGATNPLDAKAGTLRAEFATSIEANAVHGSDSKEAAEREIAYFFAQYEIYKRY